MFSVFERGPEQLFRVYGGYCEVFHVRIRASDSELGFEFSDGVGFLGASSDSYLGRVGA